MYALGFAFHFASFLRLHVPGPLPRGHTSVLDVLPFVAPFANVEESV